MIVTTSARRTSKRANPDPVVLIRSSAYSSLPAPGNRVGPSDATNMPTLRSSSATGAPVFITEDGAHHYRLVGLNIEAHASGSNDALVRIGGGETTLAEFPTDITIDRCIVKGDDASATRRGIAMDAIRGAVIDSYIYSILDTADSQAVWSYNTPGPVKIVNNYLEATGENVMLGGQDPTYSNSVPSDFEIRRNHFKKQPFASWAASWGCKNLLELKNGQRVLIEGNVLDTNYLDSQSGMSFLITPRNQDGTAPWSVTQDITFRSNKMVNVGQGINTSGEDDQGGGITSQRTKRVTIQNNLMNVVNINGEDRRIHVIINGPEEVQFINNTFLIMADGGTAGRFESLSPFPKILNSVYRNNIFTGGDFEFLGTGSGTVAQTFTDHFTNPSFTYNVVIGGAGTYPGTPNYFPANNTAVGFTNYAGGDYSLSSGSTYHNAGSDGADIGADFTTLNALTLHAEDGQWGSEHATYADHTYTNAELPRTYIDTTYAAQTGNIWTVTNSSGGIVAGTGTGNRTDCSLAYALANCAVGDTIEILSSLTITPTTSFTLRAI